MPYLHRIPKGVSFKDHGVSGHTFGPLDQKGLQIYYIESEKGHDAFIVSKSITRTYFVISGNGYFTINRDRYSVQTGDLVEVPAKVEYSYSGRMTLLCISIPRWYNGNDTFIRWNQDVFGYESPCGQDHLSWYRGLDGILIFGKSPLKAYLRLNRWLWRGLPARIRNTGLIEAYGRVLHKFVRAQGRRAQVLHTFFLRNRPELELIGQLVDRKQKREAINVAVLGSSTGPEVYSIARTIRSARPDLGLTLHALDVSPAAVEFARRGSYSRTPSALTQSNIFERMTTSEMEDFFDKDGDTMSVKAWIRVGITWQVGDAGSSETVELLGPQDLVVANNFLCHMEPPEAERCLRNIARLVRPGGFLLVSGVDLEVRARVANDLGWKPIEDFVEQIHEGDPSVRKVWPWNYSGLEPLNRRKRDWKKRYTAAFQLRLNKEEGGGRSGNSKSVSSVLVGQNAGK
jgi:chemotaxis methyl-accepting protein methylase